MSRWHRLGIAVVLLVAVFVLGVHAGATEDQRKPYSATDPLGTDYDSHVGEQRLLFGIVENVSGDRARIRVGYSNGSFALNVTNFSATVQRGGSVQVYGTLGPDHTMRAENVVVVNPASGSTLFKYAISTVAVLLFLVVFFRYWRVDVDTLQVEARDDG